MNLEGFLNESLDGGPRGYGSTFRKAVRALMIRIVLSSRIST